MNASDVRAHLVRHLPADAREAGHRDRMLALLDAADPFAAAHFTPGHFTASAFVLSPDRASLLLILHGKLGLWLQPGGHIEPDDASIQSAALREVAEETGIVDAVLEPGFPDLLDLDIHLIPARPAKNEPAHEHFDLRILLRAPSLDFAAASDAKAAKWVPLEQVEDAGTDDSVRRAVRKLLSRRSA